MAHVEASQVIPPLEKSCRRERSMWRYSQFKILTEEKNERISRDFRTVGSYRHRVLDRTTDRVQLEELLEEYQHLFALNLKELGRTSLVQHEIKLSDDKPFKQRYRGIPPHQYEEVWKHLQEMLAVGAI